jgi:hypothetical protein
MDLMGWFGADLLAEEQDQIRSAADALLFSQSLESDREARTALAVASHLVLRRVASGSTLGGVGDRLLLELVCCGPESLDLPRAA